MKQRPTFWTGLDLTLNSIKKSEPLFFIQFPPETRTNGIPVKLSSSISMSRDWTWKLYWDYEDVVYGNFKTRTLKFQYLRRTGSNQTSLSIPHKGDWQKNYL